MRYQDWNIIAKIIHKLKVNSAAGPDGLPPIFYRQTVDAIKYPLLILFRSLIDLHAVPSEWKLSTITPIFKKGSPSDPANYRPISLTCTCCKILESIIACELLEYLSSHNLITKHQHGFLKKHSTTTNLLESVNDWSLALSNHHSVLIAYIDFQRAFDSVSHSKLLHKLSRYGICGNLLSWISSFLSNRLQQVKVGSSLSETCQVVSGVPQGSVIGPLLFNLFINDITDCLDSTTSTSKLFADDIKIYTELLNHNSSVDFQSELDLIHQWSVRWQLPISHSKCYLLSLGRQEASVTSFTINGVHLTISNLSTDLGVIVDPDLKFDRHVFSIVARAKQRAAIIHRCFLSRNVNNLILAFKTYVRPLLEYAPQVWSLHLSYLIDAIESVQRSFTKRLPGFANLTYAERLTNLKLDSLEQRRMHFDVTLCYNIVHGLSAIRFDDMFTFNNSCTRGHSLKLNVPVGKSDVRKYSFAVRVVPIWNSLPEKIVTASTTKSFKHLILSHNFNVFLKFRYM